MTQRLQLLHKSVMHLRPLARAAVVVAASLLLVAVLALPAEAQARNTRPPDTPTAAPSGHSGSSGSSGSASSGSSGSAPVAGRSSGSSGRTRVSRGRGDGRAVVTRPPGGSGGGVISNDSRYRRYPGQRGYYYPGRHYYRYGYDYGYPWSWYPYRYSWWLGYDGWYGWAGWDGWGVGWGSYPYYTYPHYPPVVYYPSQVRPNMGALDLDLKPGNTEIYVNGQRIGTADDFDGWPQYLWLEDGDYHFIFYRQGFEPIVREYKILPGVVIDVEDRLPRGDTPPIESLFPPPTERRDERIRANAEQRARVEAERRSTWRERSEAMRGEAAQGDFGSLLLSIDPPDASVYLDGEFLGTGDDIVRLRLGLTVDAGDHTLSVVRPGYEAEEVELSVEAGEQVNVSVRLDPR
jgi:hypothetical protein